MNVKTLSFEEVDELKRSWTEKYVQVDDSRPELKRFAGRTGRVITVNMSGRALVQFDDAEGWGWGRYDIGLPFLKQVAAPAPAVKEKGVKHAEAEKPQPVAGPSGEAKPAAKMSPIELMRAKAAAKAAGEKPPAEAPAPAEAKPAKMSPIEIMRAKAAAKAAGAPSAGQAPTSEAPAESAAKPAGKLSPIEMIRAKAAAKAAGGESKPSEEKPTEGGESKPAAKMSPLELIRAKAAAKKAAEEGKSG
jgi:hypothetical protein